MEGDSRRRQTLALHDLLRFEDVGCSAEINNPTDAPLDWNSYIDDTKAHQELTPTKTIDLPPPRLTLPPSPHSEDMCDLSSQVDIERTCTCCLDAKLHGIHEMPEIWASNLQAELLSDVTSHSKTSMAEAACFVGQQLAAAHGAHSEKFDTVASNIYALNKRCTKLNDDNESTQKQLQALVEKIQLLAPRAASTMDESDSYYWKKLTSSMHDPAFADKFKVLLSNSDKFDVQSANV